MVHLNIPLPSQGHIVNEEQEAREGSSEREDEKLADIEGTEEVIRVRIPQKANREVLCIVEKMLGGRRVTVQCIDGIERMARIPGRLKRKQWVQVGDVVIVVPWDFQDEKADLIYRYKRPQAEWLRKKGYLK